MFKLNLNLEICYYQLRMKSRRLSRGDFFPILTLVLLVSFFFGYQLFWPLDKGPKIFATPDFGRSDTWHLNLALKNYLSKSFKTGDLPLWSNDIGRGFPLLAEGQSGVFQIYNLAAFFLLPGWLAFNLGFIFIFATTIIGSYLFSRQIRLSRTASVLSACSFAFSFVFVSHISHFNLIQTASFIPWLFLAATKMLNKESWLWGAVFSFLLGQQIFSGFPQLVLYTLMTLSFYMVWAIKDLGRRNAAAMIGRWLFVILLGFGLSAIQLAPQFELLEQTSRTGGTSVFELARFPLHPKNLLNFFYPYANGDPRLGRYERFGQNWGIFWESTGYFGILSWLLFLAATVYVWKNKQKKYVLYQGLSLINLTAFVLMLGKFTPFFFLFQMPPLSFFRVPARFLFIFVFTASVLAGFGLERLRKKLKGKLGQILAASAALITIVDLFYYGLNYNLTAPVRDLLKPPKTAGWLLQQFTSSASQIPPGRWNGDGTRKPRIYSLANFEPWNEVFINKGWQGQEESYLYFRNSLDPNLNLLYGIANVHHYESIQTKRTEIFQALIRKNLSKRLLGLAGADYMVTTTKLDETQWPLATRVEGSPDYLVYQNPESFPLAWFVENAEIVKSVPELVEKLLDEKIDLRQTVILEEDKNFASQAQGKEFTLEIADWNNRQKEFVVKSEADGFLVVNQSYYPGWQAVVDGKAEKVLPADLNLEAVFVPQGEHKVILEYKPKSFYSGVLISSISAGILIWLSIISFRRLWSSG